jgi:hypothetical protein
VATIPRASWISWRIFSDHGSPPKRPYLRESAETGIPISRIVSATSIA